MIWTVHTALGPIVVREQIEPEDEPGILALFASCSDWFEAVTGGPPGPGDVQSLFYSLPEGTTFEDKRLFTVRHDDSIVGLVDAVVGFPHRRACSIGLFLIAPSHRRRGVGTAVARTLLDEARATGLQHVSAAANDSWPAGQAFLRSLGFTLGGVVTDHGNRNVTSAESPPRRATLDLEPSHLSDRR